MARRISVPPLDPRLSLENSLRIRVAAGASLDFSLTILSYDAAERIPYFIAGVANMAHAGLGMPRRRFRLEQVSFADQTVMAAEIPQPLRPVANPPTLYDLCNERLASLRVDDRLEIRLLTPIWLRELGQTVLRPSFFHIIKFTLLRLKNLFRHFADGALDLDEKALLDAARQVETLNETLWQHDFDFYSNRRRRKESHSGILGVMIFTGPDLARFLPLLVAGEVVHIGTKTSFGLGRYEVSANV